MSEKATRILSHLYIGGKADAKNKEYLKKLGIRYILNCTPQRSVDRENGCPNYYEKDKEFVYKRIPIFDNKGENISAHMETAFRFIEEGKHYGGVLVHCHKGISRSASFVMGYLMQKNEMSFREAFDFVKSCRSIVQPNASFLDQLMDFDQQLSTLRAAEETKQSTMDKDGFYGASLLSGPSLIGCDADTGDRSPIKTLTESVNLLVDLTVSHSNTTMIENIVTGPQSNVTVSLDCQSNVLDNGELDAVGKKLDLDSSSDDTQNHAKKMKLV